MLSPLKFDMVAFESTKEVSVKKKKKSVSNIFLIMTESGFPGSLGSLTFEDAASDFKKKNPNP